MPTAWLARCLHPLLLAASLLLSACATQLAPAYEPAVVSGLERNSIATLTLLASLAGGTQAANFSQREAAYAQRIGELDALALQAGARPEPSGPLQAKLKDWLQAKGMSEPDARLPSVHALQRVSATLAKLRDTDRKQGLSAVEVQAFRGQVLIYLDQALSYEYFLAR